MISFFQRSGFKFFFSPSESENLAHVIITGKGGQMIVFLNPLSPALAHNMTDNDQEAAMEIVKEYHQLLMARWFEWHESFSRCA